jgi:hypothetical protein
MYRVNLLGQSRIFGHIAEGTITGLGILQFALKYSISRRLLMGRHQSNSSRREFLTALAGTGGAMLLAPRQLSADVDPRVAQIVSRTTAVDMHSHVQIRFVKDPADAKPDPIRTQQTTSAV